MTRNAWDLHGHDHAVEGLRRAIASDHLSHAFLFAGPRGVGKDALARRLAQTLIAPSADDRTLPDLEARAAKQIDSGALGDVEHIAIGGMCDEAQHDHASDNSTRIRICQVRRVERIAALAPFASPRRIFIVDTADELQPEAAHALLKTLEEPPGAALIILLATDVDALLPTIRSRCQEFVLRPLPHATLTEALQQDAGLEEAEASALAHLAHGRYGLAMRMHADPSMAVLRESVATEVRRLASAGRNERMDVSARLGDGWYRERESVLATIDLWREWWRDALLAGAGVEEAARASDGMPSCSAEDALRALLAVQKARDHLLANTNAQLALDVMMLDLPVLPAGENTGEERAVATA